MNHENTGSVPISPQSKQKNERMLKRNCLEIVNNAHMYLLEEAFKKSSHEEYHALKMSYAQHMDLMANYCMENFVLQRHLTTDFIRNLHRLFYPPGFTQKVQLKEGGTAVLIPGEYKQNLNSIESYVKPGQRKFFLDPAFVERDMEQAVDELNRDIAVIGNKTKKERVILTFIHSFFKIHPFFDSNGRLAFILADLLLLREGVTPINFTLIKRLDKLNLYRTIEYCDQVDNIKPLIEYVHTIRNDYNQTNL